MLTFWESICKEDEISGDIRGKERGWRGWPSYKSSFCPPRTIPRSPLWDERDCYELYYTCSTARCSTGQSRGLKSEHAALHQQHQRAAVWGWWVSKLSGPQAPHLGYKDVFHRLTEHRLWASPVPGTGDTKIGYRKVFQIDNRLKCQKMECHLGLKPGKSKRATRGDGD